MNRESLADDSNSLARVLQTEGFSSEIDTTTMSKSDDVSLFFLHRNLSN